MRFMVRTATQAFLFMLGLLAVEPASATTFTLLPAGSPLISTVTTTPQVLYSAEITYNNGDILQAISELEVNNDNDDTTAHVYAKVVLGTSSSDTTGSLLLGEANARVIRDPNGHHGVRVKGAITQLGTSGSQQTGYVNVVVWADASLDVVANNGMLQGMVITPSTGATFTVYDSGHGSELLTSLTGDNTFRPLYSVNVGDLEANDILIVFSEGQLQASTVSGKQRLTAHVLRATTASGTGGTGIDQPNALTITSTDLIGTLAKVAVHKVQSATTRTYVNFLVQSTVDMTISPDTGRLEVLKIRPAS